MVDTYSIVNQAFKVASFVIKDTFAIEDAFVIEDTFVIKDKVVNALYFFNWNITLVKVEFTFIIIKIL